MDNMNLKLKLKLNKVSYHEISYHIGMNPSTFGVKIMRNSFTLKEEDAIKKFLKKRCK